MPAKAFLQSSRAADELVRADPLIMGLVESVKNRGKQLGRFRFNDPAGAFSFAFYVVVDENVDCEIIENLTREES